MVCDDLVDWSGECGGIGFGENDGWVDRGYIWGLEGGGKERGG